MKISVCIATYNGERFILDQLGTILPQLSPDDEVVISDDSSTDRTVQKIKSLGDSRIKIYEGQQFRSPIFNFENALKLASNDYIFMSDQDDLWMDGKVAAMKKSLETHDMVVCDHAIIDDEGKTLVDSFFATVKSVPGIWQNMKKNTYYGCCMAFHKRVLYRACPFPKDIPMHDIWLGFVADLFFKSEFIRYPYTLYRRHDNNVTSASNLKSENSLMKKISYRINYIKYFPLLLTRINKQHI